MTVHRIQVPFAGVWLTANRERFRFNRAKHVKAWRDAVHEACLTAKPRPPKGITPVKVHVVAYYTGRAPVRDKTNIFNTIKACVDGLTPLKLHTRKLANGRVQRYTSGGYGLLPDDSDRHVLDTTWELRPSETGQPYVLLEVEHVEEVADGEEVDTAAGR